MSIEKQDPTFLKRYLIPLLAIYGVSALLGAGILIGLMIFGHRQLGMILFGAVVVLMMAAFFLLRYLVLGRYQCPQCRRVLPRHQDLSRPADYLFYCNVCDVVWKTGLRKDDGSH